MRVALMWRFSLPIKRAVECDRMGFLHARVVEDWEFSEVVDSFNANELVFAVRQPQPESLKQGD